MAIQPPDNLLRARRALDELPFYELVDDWAWNDTVKNWVLRCRLTVQPFGLIPATTDWFVLADADYPWGDIEFYPAKDGGLTCTFPHQSYNGEGKAGVPWRDGKICAQTAMRYAGRRAYDIEPFSTDERLRWRMIRSREWLEAAGAGRVAEKGEPFELPDFPRESASGLGFVEDAASFRFWQTQTTTFGVATVIQPDGVERWAVVATFSDIREKAIRTVEYGAMLSHRSVHKATAMWIMLSKVPVFPPWQSPDTFGDLRSVMTKQGIDFNDLIRSLAPHFRDGKRHLLLLGFPISATIGGEFQRYHWQGLRMPALTHDRLNGYRPIEANFVMNDTCNILGDKVHIDWVISRNWDEQEIRTRGRASSHLTDSKILLLGTGAMGSAVAELLVREGCKAVTLVDGDILDAGNLCRHTLSLRNIFTFKADSLAARLNSLSPHVTVNSIPRDFQESAVHEEHLEAECEIIIDCTGDDRVAYQMSTFPWAGSKLFASVSMGLCARRLFIFGAQGAAFPHAEFGHMLAPWLKTELKEYEGLELPREGPGCWHPIFPARSDDVWLMSAIAVKCIDAWAANPPRSPLMNVYEQEQKNGLSMGVRLVAGS